MNYADLVRRLSLDLTDAAAELVPALHGRYWDVHDYVETVLVKVLRPVAQEHRGAERTARRLYHRLRKANATIRKLKGAAR
jgi:hypothetical protein